MAKKTNIINLEIPPIFYLLIILFLAGISWAGDNIQPFVDLDGDGFNDSPPVVVSSTPPASIDSSQVTSKFVSFDLAAPASSQSLSFSDRFSLLQFDCRSVSRNRCSMDIDNDFGPGTAVGIVSISGVGGVCSGGTCHR